ncbi:ankyrin repeat-containing domain protein [Aspergillus pseudocaelatus]|uniref:Ankyrin repeat-containing domain protein n=1 Tax=Aspergillus pseudocaelatus TaxID=1825620 RepID=A0ABQ6WDZ8_9EURO|nr:ankyrin repeat-containing domain protein [Aspergillus pseudocaelatus]
MTRGLALPYEVILLGAGRLDLPTLCSFLRALPQVATLLSPVYFSIRDESGNSILHILAGEGEYKLLLQALKSRGASPGMKNKDMDAPFSLAVSRGYLLVVQTLLHRIDVDANFTNDMGKTLLHLASLSGQESILDLLTHWPGTDINKKDKHGQTAVSLAAENGQER